MLVGSFLENPKKYPDFDFKPVKIPKLLSGEGCFEHCFGENGFHFPNIFQKILKNIKIRILYPKHTTSIPITLLSKSPTPRERMSPDLLYLTRLIMLHPTLIFRIPGINFEY